MSIVIDTSRCIGCAACCKICPGSLLRLIEHESQAVYAQIRYPDECWNCAACVKKCPRQAIALYLPPESGGNGARLQAQQKGTLLHWVARFSDNTQKTIIVDSRNPNHY